MRRRLPKPSKPTAFALLMVASAACVLLPAEYTSPLKAVVQFVVPLQEAGYRLTQQLADRSEQLSASRPTWSHYQKLVRRTRALENQLVALSELLEHLRSENQQLARLRQRRALAGGRLIPARIVAQDPVSWREPLLLGRGRAHGLHRNDLVASRLLSIHSQHRLANELAVIAGEYLIGRIQQLGPFTARLLLFSDPQSPPHPVRIGRLADGRFSPLSKQDPRTGRWQPCTFLLRGLGDGVMAIEQVLADYIADRPGSQTAAVRNPIRLGDLVVSLPDEPRLPCTMVIAELTGLQPDPRNPLIYNLEARCPVDPTRLRWVYVVDMSAPSGD